MHEVHSDHWSLVADGGQTGEPDCSSRVWRRRDPRPRAEELAYHVPRHALLSLLASFFFVRFPDRLALFSPVEPRQVMPRRSQAPPEDVPVFTPGTSEFILLKV